MGGKKLSKHLKKTKLITLEILLYWKKKTKKKNQALFKEEDYYKPERVSNFWNNNYIEYESNSDTSKNLSLDKYLDKSKPYSRDIIIDLPESNAWKIQLTIVINLISSKDAEEECVIHSKSNNVKLSCWWTLWFT